MMCDCTSWYYIIKLLYFTEKSNIPRLQFCMYVQIRVKIMYDGTITQFTQYCVVQKLSFFEIQVGICRQISQLQTCIIISKIYVAKREIWSFKIRNVTVQVSW